MGSINQDREIVSGELRLKAKASLAVVKKEKYHAKKDSITVKWQQHADNKRIMFLSSRIRTQDNSLMD